MKGDAVLTESEATEVIRTAGYQVVSFERGAPPERTAWLFRVNDFEPDERARLESGLREDLPDADKVAVDSLGMATVVVSRDATAAGEAISASLVKRGVAAEGLVSRSWPKLDATYVVAISGGMNDAAETRAVSDALAGVAKVVAVHVQQDTGSATLWLKEPCDALEANVTAALTSAGFSVARFELEAD